ncbi:uroporphyrinogen-III synthase [Barrientosiimonas marina]|uniref:Uroporphyrinogen-III synthase n=1 Tax=Lentibacillus kimchii TaxID=1542911 RepID=A0ABW2UXZ0_9BACI
MVSGLQGKQILITREEKQASVFADQISQYGGVPVQVPLLKITCQHHTSNKELLRSPGTYKWLFFTSANGVSCFFNFLSEEQAVQDFTAGSKFAAVGRKTARVLESYGYQADFIPTTYNAETMTREFFSEHTQLEEPVLLIQGNLSRRILPVWFNEQGIRYNTMEVYRTDVHHEMKDQLNATITQQRFDAITFTSPSSVNAFMEMKNVPLADATPICCIGTTTEQRAASFGFRNLLVPEEFTIGGMVRRLETYFTKN